MSDQNFMNTLTRAHLSELRRIITGLDEEDLSRLNNLIKDPDEFSDHIMEFLPLSIKKLVESNRVSLDEVVPFIEQSIQTSIQKNPEKFANILYPIMIPAIRKAVAEDIKRMLDSVSSTVDNSFSPKRIGWRFQSIFSGKSYGEIVMSNAFVYRVRQVFLIHKVTGLLLTDMTDEKGGIAHNADMVSSMLSAIKDFAKDSFKVDNSDSDLNTIQMGEYTIWIEQGPYAIIAAIIEGRPPEEFKVVLKESIEGIHVNFDRELKSFDGDTDIFNKSNRFLSNCIQQQEKPQKKKKPVASIIILLLLLAGLGYWIYTCVDSKIRFNHFTNRIENQAGVVISKIYKADGTRIILGLKDPFSVNPYKYANQYGFDSSNVILKFRPYISLENPMILLRVGRKLPHIDQSNLAINKGTLYLRGDFTQHEADSIKEVVLTIPGIEYVKFGHILNNNKKIVMQNVFNIEKHFFTFGYNKTQLDSVQQVEFNALIKEINQVFNFNFNQDSVPVVLVISHTSKTGNAEANKIVAFRRAKQFIGLMINVGIPMEALVPTVSFVEDNSSAISYPIRSVSFKVKYVKPEDL